jgi:hypothetical protein
MKATLEFNLPEEEDDHKYALAGLDALLVISDIFTEIRSKLKYDSGEFKGCDDATLEKVRDFITDLKYNRNLPELR